MDAVASETRSTRKKVPKTDVYECLQIEFCDESAGATGMPRMQRLGARRIQEADRRRLRWSASVQLRLYGARLNVHNGHVQHIALNLNVVFARLSPHEAL